LTKLLVAGGNDIFTFRSSVEVINLDESNPDLTCQNLPDSPVPLFAMTGKLNKIDSIEKLYLLIQTERSQTIFFESLLTTFVAIGAVSKNCLESWF